MDDIDNVDRGRSVVEDEFSRTLLPQIRHIRRAVIGFCDISHTNHAPKSNG